MFILHSTAFFLLGLRYPEDCHRDANVDLVIGTDSNTLSTSEYQYDLDMHIKNVIVTIFKTS